MTMRETKLIGLYYALVLVSLCVAVYAGYRASAWVDSTLLKWVVGIIVCGAVQAFLSIFTALLMAWLTYEKKE